MKNWKLVKERNASMHTVNIRMVMATLASGMGPANLSDFMAFLNLPHCKSFSGQVFKNIENKLGEHIINVAEKPMENGKQLEAKMKLKEINESYDEWQKDTTSKLGLTVSYDMGWSKRSSGNRYDSPTGHSFMIGCLSGQIIGAKVLSKGCRKCSSSEKAGDKNTNPMHQCPKNYSGSSKGMESTNALLLVKELFYKSGGRLYVARIVSDDDSTSSALLKHKSPLFPNGQLPEEIPEPEWDADPNHRVKSALKKVHALAYAPKKISLLEPFDARKIGRNFAYCLHRNKGKTIEDMMRGMEAVVQHHWGNHAYCDTDWCSQLRQENNLLLCLPVSSDEQTSRPHTAICCPTGAGDPQSFATTSLPQQQTNKQQNSYPTITATRDSLSSSNTSLSQPQTNKEQNPYSPTLIFPLTPAKDPLSSSTTSSQSFTRPLENQCNDQIRQGRHYRDKEKDPVTFNQVSDALAPFRKEKNVTINA